MLFYRIPAPNEALVVTGSKGVGGAPLRVVTGKGAFVWPWKAKARSLSLDLRQAMLNEPCVTKQGITLSVQAVAVFKVGNDPESITNAATRFLDQQDRVAQTIGRVLAGHLRSTVGNMTVEEIISSRNTLAQEIRDAASDEMQKMGLDIDAFQIQEILDNSGYIDNIAAPHLAAIERDARIAKAQADQVAAEKEQEASALKARYSRDTEIKQAGFTAETEQARAKAAQAGPLAEAQASQEVVEERTRLAEREAELTDKRLASDVRRPADAEAYKTRTLAAADAEALNLRADALQGENQSLLAANKLVDLLPQLVEAASKGITGSNLTVLNGSEGLNDLAAGIVSQGLAIFETLKPALSRDRSAAPISTNGGRPQEAVADEAAERPK